MVNTEIQLKRHYGRHIAVLRNIEYNHVTRFIVRCKIKLESIIASCWNYLDVNVDIYRQDNNNRFISRKHNRIPPFYR